MEEGAVGRGERVIGETEHVSLMRSIFRERELVEWLKW
jgi:hypothetical protein